VESALNLAQIVISLLLTAVILVQQRDAGLSSVFGGDTTVYHTRRGIEKMIFRATVGLAVLFVGTALANIALR
jgi:preprotein translocase subunit SecG